jgi:hypothetical protein
VTRYSYEIGTTETTTNIETVLISAGFPAGLAPKGRFIEYTVPVDKIDGHRAGHGAPMAIWEFDILTQAMVNTLRSTYCPGYSANVYINTRKNDGSYAKYSAIMIWPQDQMEKRNFNGRYLGLQFEFRQLEAV